MGPRAQALESGSPGFCPDSSTRCGPGKFLTSLRHGFPICKVDDDDGDEGYENSDDIWSL